MGAGTGLGLDISYRVVTGKHAGIRDLRVGCGPGDTRFEVQLPLRDAVGLTPTSSAGAGRRLTG